MSIEFVVVVLVVVLVPGADFIVTLRNTVMHGRSAGAATALGVGAASVIQGTLVSVGLGAVIVRSQVLFTTLRWLGVAYLFYLAVQALRSAWRGRYETDPQAGGPGERAKGLRQGFLTNITNPKMFVFYLSLLPQFVGVTAPVWQWLVHAWVLPALGTAYLIVLAVLAGALRDRLLRPVVRRTVDAVSGVALLGFGARLATSRA